MARKRGSAILIKTGATPATIALQTETSLTLTKEPVAVTTKDDTNNVYVAGIGDWTAECSGSYDQEDTTHDQAFTDINTGAEVDIEVLVDEETYSGKAFISSMSFSGSMDGPNTYSLAFQGSGALTKVDDPV